MNKTVKFLLYALLFLLLLFAGLVCMVQIVYAQDTDCVLVFDDNDDPGFYDEFAYTDPQGRDVCKVRIVFHDPAPEDPNGAVFTESGSINGYTADFNGASVHVWRTGSPYSISHTRVWVLAVPSTSTPPPPTDTEVPTMTLTASGTPPDNTPTWTLTTTPLTPTWTTTAGTPVTPTLIPPVTNMPPTVPPFTTPEGPGTTPSKPPSPGTTPMLPTTGEAGAAPLYGGIILFVIVIGFIFLKARNR